jgi:TolB-like protein
VRRLLVVALVVLGLPLLAAAPNALYAKPTVIVYPFTTNGASIDREASSRLATIIATQMATTGKVAVTPPPPGTERKDYLSVARSHGADYYVSGYVSPLGNGVSVVEQVVSAASGIVVFSQSTQLNTYAEAAGQGDDLANFIASHANRGLAQIPTPPPQAASPSPAPSGGPEANLTKLFGRKRNAATPAPRPTPSPAPRTVAVASPGAPAATSAPAAATVATAEKPYAVLPVDGPADGAVRELAAGHLAVRANAVRAANAASACAAAPRRTVLSGVLAVKPDAQGGGTATFELAARDCAGAVLWRQSRSSDVRGAQWMQAATERAVDAAADAYLNPPKHHR